MYLGVVKEYATIWLVACAGLVLSLLGFGMLRGQLESHKTVEFEWVAHNRYRALENGVWRGLDSVRSLADLMLVRSDLGDRDFRLTSRSILDRTQGMKTVLWAPASGQGRFPVEFQESLDTSAFAIGFDLASDPVIHDAFERARGSGATAVSARLDFGSDGDASSGVVAVHPVFSDPDRSGVEDETTPPAAESRAPRDLAGYVVGLFDLRSLARGAIDPLEPRGVDCLIRDESGDPGRQFLDFYASRLSPPTVLWDETAWREEAGRLSSASFLAADREWSVTCALTPRFRSAEAFVEGPWVALAASLFLTLLLTSYLIRSRQAMLHRLEMERTLRDREEVFWQMTETVSEVFWATAPDRSEFLYISPAFEDVWGIPCEDLYREPELYEQPVLKADKSAITAAIERMQREKIPFEAVFRLRREDGEIRWIRDRGFPVLNEEGEIARIVGFAEDTTEERLARDALQNSEKRLRDLFNQSPDVILTIDREGRVLFINRSTPELPAELAIGSASEVLVPAEMRSVYHSALEAVFASGEIEHFDFEKEDGTSWELRVVPLLRQEVVTAAMVIVADVTENRSLQDQAARNERLASVGVLAAGVAHEINNPNNAIGFDASVLGRAWSDIAPILSDYYEENGDFALAGLPFSEAKQTLPELLSQISTNSRRIQRIVENLKHLSRKDSNELSSTVDVRRTLEAAAGILRHQIQDCTDHFEFEIPARVPDVRGSSQQLEQVFINVILNALQSLPDRRRGVRIEAISEPEKGVVIVRVHDEGEGISKKHLDALTEPFFSTREGEGGTGLGLSISRSIIDKHQGEITFESEPGRGTTVAITLPIAETGAK